MTAESGKYMTVNLRKTVWITRTCIDLKRWFDNTIKLNSILRDTGSYQCRAWAVRDIPKSAPPLLKFGYGLACYLLTAVPTSRLTDTAVRNLIALVCEVVSGTERNLRVYIVRHRYDTFCNCYFYLLILPHRSAPRTTLGSEPNFPHWCSWNVARTTWCPS